MSSEYDALRAKVDGFAEAVAARRGDLTCRAGCSACCQVELEVSEVEAAPIERALRALSPAARARLAERVPRAGACVMLEPDGRCAIYPARPLVCRTQGLPLRYPAGTLPTDAAQGRVPGGDVTWCPLNFRDGPPAPEDVLDAERVDVMLALVNRRASDRPLRRVALRALAQARVAEDAR